MEKRRRKIQTDVSERRETKRSFCRRVPYFLLLFCFVASEKKQKKPCFFGFSFCFMTNCRMIAERCGARPLPRTDTARPISALKRVFFGVISWPDAVRSPKSHLILDASAPESLEIL